MWSRQSFKRAVALLTLILFLQGILLPVIAQAQDACAYDKKKPTLASARQNLRLTNYVCAELELKGFLVATDISLEERADAHILLASVYYAMVNNNSEKSTKVREQFVEAFKAFRNWKGDLDIDSDEFLQLMEEAKTHVDQQQKKEPVEIVVAPAKKGKPWYKKWWALGGIGGGIVVLVVALSGSKDEPEPVPTPTPALPGFPDNPPR